MVCWGPPKGERGDLSGVFLNVLGAVLAVFEAGKHHAPVRDKTLLFVHRMVDLLGERMAPWPAGPLRRAGRTRLHPSPRAVDGSTTSSAECSKHEQLGGLMFSCRILWHQASSTPGVARQQLVQIRLVQILVGPGGGGPVRSQGHCVFFRHFCASITDIQQFSVTIFFFGFLDFFLAYYLPLV